MGGGRPWSCGLRQPLGQICTPIDLEVVVESDAPERLTLPQWNFYDSEGCMVQPGTYTVVAEVPEHDLITSKTVEFLSVEANPCTSPDAATLTAALSWQDDRTVRLNAEAFTNQADHLRMAQPCTFEVAFLDEEDNTVHLFQTLCDAYDGRKILLPDASQSLKFDAVDISMVQDGSPLLPDGFYTLSLTMLSTSSSTTTLPLAWPADFGAQETDEPMVETPETFELTGSWAGLLTDEGTCYVMESDGETYLLSNARTLSSWQPSARNQGVYVVVEAALLPLAATIWRRRLKWSRSAWNNPSSAKKPPAWKSTRSQPPLLPNPTPSSGGERGRYRLRPLDVCRGRRHQRRIAIAGHCCRLVVPRPRRQNP